MKLATSLFAVCFVPLALSVCAAEAKEAAIDPTGTWKWSYVLGPGNVLEAQLKLWMHDGKLTGVAIGPDHKELPIEKTEFKGQQIRFEVTRLVQGKKFTTRYEGTITGDRLKGKSSAGPAQTKAPSRDWEAVRVREEKPPVQADRGPSRPATSSNDR